MDSLALIGGVILGPIGVVLFLRFVVWNGLWWLVAQLRGKHRDSD